MPRLLRTFVNFRILLIMGKKEVHLMFKRKYYLCLEETEQRVLLRSLVRMKNRLIRERRCTDCVDELLLKICSAPVQRL